MDGCGQDWVAFIKGELPPREDEQAREHLTACKACRAEEAALRATLQCVRETLAPVEPSARMRSELARRIEAASSGRASRAIRHFDAASSGSGRRSRYFFASVALHAAALAAVVVWWVSSPSFSVSSKSGGSGEGNGGSLLGGEGMDMRRMNPVQSRLVSGYTDIDGMKMDGGVMVTIKTRAADGLYVLTFGGYVPCVVAYPAATDAEAEALEKKFAWASPRRARAEAGHLVVPDALAVAFQGDTKLRVFDLDDRVEFWSLPAWNRYEEAQRLAPLTPVAWAGERNLLLWADDRRRG